MAVPDADKSSRNLRNPMKMERVVGYRYVVKVAQFPIRRGEILWKVIETGEMIMVP